MVHTVRWLLTIVQPEIAGPRYLRLAPDLAGDGDPVQTLPQECSHLGDLPLPGDYVRFDGRTYQVTGRQWSWLDTPDGNRGELAMVVRPADCFIEEITELEAD